MRPTPPDGKPAARFLGIRPQWLVVLVVVLGVALTAGAVHSVQAAAEARLASRFEREASLLAAAVGRRAERQIDVLWAVRNYLEAEGEPGRAGFAAFSAGQRAQHPGIQALEWVPTVPAGSRAAFEVRARREHGPAFRLTEQGPDGALVEAGDAPVHWPILYVEPFAGNERALGFAPRVHTRNVAISRALSTGKATATGRFELVQGDRRRAAIAIFLPVYETASPGARRARGLVEGVFYISELLDAVVADAARAGIRLGLVDASVGADERDLVTSAFTPGSQASEGLLRYDMVFDVAGRGWHATFTLVDPRHLARQDVAVTLVLLGGFLLTTLLAILVARRETALAQAEALGRMQVALANAVSHDLRTPLTSVLGYAEFLAEELEGSLTPAQVGYMDQIRRGARRLEGLVDDLLDYARIDAGILHMRKSEVDVGAIVAQAATSLRPQVQAAGLTLSVDVGPGPLPATVDEARVERVVVNLLQNAVKFSDRGGRIALTVRGEDGWVVCEVADTGVGIPAAHHVKLFAPFTQAEDGVRRGGTGLGLSISKAIVEAHGGVIGVRSEVGLGSTFWFRLPA